MPNPFFSVLLPAFNAKAHIGAAIRDILAQTFRDFELLVVDDGSTDGTSECVAKFSDPRLRLIRFPANQGLVAALNAGLQEARGKWIARQDADDRSRRDRLAKQARLLSENPDKLLVYSQARLIDEWGFWRGKLRPPVEDKGLRWDFCFRNAIPHTSAVFPLELARDVLGGYRDCKACEDYDLWSRLLRHGKAVGSPETLVSYRNHAASIMGQEHAVQAESRNVALKQIMANNLREWIGANEQEVALLASAWLGNGDVDWEEYFKVTNRFAIGELSPSTDLLAEQDFTLLNRAADASAAIALEMLLALKKTSPERYASLPQPRTFITRLLKRI
jgi:glycosyltransferase involved in cell wall biosynthesis